MKSRFFMAFVFLILLAGGLGWGCWKATSPAARKAVNTRPRKVQAPPAVLKLATTTSTENTGLLEYLLPAFEKKYNAKVNVIAVGTGKAMEIARDGNVDALLVHDKKSELEFVAQGWGLARREVMYNDFLIVGPRTDPAGIAHAPEVIPALARLAQAGAAFVSRGDDSGTHKAELRMWESAGVQPSGAWYREVGQGMEKTLRMADDLDAYTLCDRGTWLAVRNTLGLIPIVEGDPILFNLYGVMAVNPDKHTGVSINRDLAEKFVAWITSPEGRELIAGFKIDGEELFHPLAAQ